MSLETFQKIAFHLKQYGAHIGFISGGEALLVPHLIPILEQANKAFSTATTLVTGLYHKTDIVENVADYCLQKNINIQTSLDAKGALGDNLRGAEHFSDTVLNHMEMISRQRKRSKSLLYVNIVLNNLNLEQVPDLIATAKSLGWKSTIGLYHHLTETTREDDELNVKPGPRLDALLNVLDGNPDILNLNSFIRGIDPFLRGERLTPCPFVASPFWMTRTTIMENGDVHLCHGEPIGNIATTPLHDIFSSPAYQQRLESYNSCSGCWTTCYTQRYLLIHPRSPRELVSNIKKIIKLKRHHLHPRNSGSSLP
jgi:MoaA/NifB/PqqE/SkfB family radical SAM enzyme